MRECHYVSLTRVLGVCLENTSLMNTDSFKLVENIWTALHPSGWTSRALLKLWEYFDLNLAIGKIALVEPFGYIIANKDSIFFEATQLRPMYGFLENLHFFGETWPHSRKNVGIIFPPCGASGLSLAMTFCSYDRILLGYMGYGKRGRITPKVWRQRNWSASSSKP